MGQECTPTPKWTEFVDLVGADSGIIESICQPDYGPFFTTAVGVIDYACDFIPPGCPRCGEMSWRRTRPLYAPEDVLKVRARCDLPALRCVPRRWPVGSTPVSPPR